MTGHTMSVQLERDMVVLTPVCHEPEGALCRLRCDSGCPDYDSDHGHELVDRGYCNVEWLTDGGNAAEFHAGETEISLYDGMPITVQWNGEGYEWSKADRDA